jgi:hypothetical protein
MPDLLPFPQHQADNRVHLVVYDGRRLFLAVNPHREPRLGTGPSTGWKRYVWRRDPAEALRFVDREAAVEFAGEWLPPGWHALPAVEAEAVEPVGAASC